MAREKSDSPINSKNTSTVSKSSSSSFRSIDSETASLKIKNDLHNVSRNSLHEETSSITEEMTAAAIPEDAPKYNDSPSSTPETEVIWQYKHRYTTDTFSLLLFLCFYSAFLGCGIHLHRNARQRYEWDSITNSRIVSENFQGEVVDCCISIQISDKSKEEVVIHDDLCHQLEPVVQRRKLPHRSRSNWDGVGVKGGATTASYYAGNSTNITDDSVAEVISELQGDEGIFDVFASHPEIIRHTFALTIGLAIVWSLLLQVLTLLTIFLTELIDVAVFIAIGVVGEMRLFFFFLASLLLAYTVWNRGHVIFANNMIRQANLAIKGNIGVYFGLVLGILGLFCGHAVFFISSLSKGMENVFVGKETVCIDDDNCHHTCQFASVGYLRDIVLFQSLSFLWVIFIFDSIRLSVLSFIVGSWHFHPTQKPSVLRAIFYSVSTSLGTLSFASLANPIGEKINKLAEDPIHTSVLSCMILVNLPMLIFMCLWDKFTSQTLAKLTRYATIFHCFKGESLKDSGQIVYKIMSKRFTGGFVQELNSRSVLKTGCFVYSAAITLYTWTWLDQILGTNTLTFNHSSVPFVLWVAYTLFCLWYPMLGVYITMSFNYFIMRWEGGKRDLALLDTKEEDDESIKETGTQRLWISPLAAVFVGCMCMMMLSFVAGIFLDICDILILCFAMDKEKNMASPRNEEIAKLVRYIPGYKSSMIVVPSSDISEAAVVGVVMGNDDGTQDLESQPLTASGTGGVKKEGKKNDGSSDVMLNTTRVEI